MLERRHAVPPRQFLPRLTRWGFPFPSCNLARALPNGAHVVTTSVLPGSLAAVHTTSFHVESNQRLSPHQGAER